MSSKLPEKIDLASIQRFIDADDLRKQLVSQLEKDLPNLIVDVPLEDTRFFQIILDIIHAYITDHIENQPDGIAQLLYSVDVNESKVRAVLKHNHVDSAKKIALLVLEKETQKVFIRNVYNGSIII